MYLQVSCSYLCLINQMSNIYTKDYTRAAQCCVGVELFYTDIQRQVILFVRFMWAISLIYSFFSFITKYF